MNFLARLAREPVLHFLVAGGLLYFAALAFRGQELLPDDETTIEVDRESLLTFMQFRANAFDTQAFAAALDAMSAEERQRLIDDFLTEEVLYREARALKLEESDYIIRQRLVQKMQFLLGDLAGGESSFTDDELQAYFTANIEVWRVQPSATFTHVFFDSVRRGDEQARRDAETLRDEFNQRGVGFNDADGSGDRFPFLKNYVERTFEYLAGQFGTEFVASLETLDAAATWQGPLKSAFGWHIVMLTAKLPARYPELDEVRQTVEQDFMLERAERQLRDMTDTVKARYRVNVSDSLQGEPQP